MIVGLVGLIGSGKSTTASILEKEYDFTPVAFADSLKDVLASVFSWDRALLEGTNKSSRLWREQKDEWWSSRLGMDVTPRKMLQQIGTDLFRRYFDPDIWVLSTLKKLHSDKNYVFTDMRFENEINSVLSLGGKIYRVKRGDDPKWFQTALEDKKTMDIDYPDVHRSEYDWIGLHNYDIIGNDGSIGELCENIKRVVFNGER